MSESACLLLFLIVYPIDIAWAAARVGSGSPVLLGRDADAALVEEAVPGLSLIHI